MAIVSFDIETSNVFTLKPGEDLEKYAPFDVAVAAVGPSGGECAVWMSAGPDGKPLVNLTRAKARELLAHLASLQAAGHRLCAWNGASFDLKWIGHAAQNFKTAARIALELYDPMLQFFNQMGYPVGLDAVARGMKVGATKLLKSEDAPQLWARGEHGRVIEYVRSDVAITNAVVAAIERTRAVRWVTRRGDSRSETIGNLKTVRQVLAEPEPDQSWMDRKIPRGKFVDWILREKQ